MYRLRRNADEAPDQNFGVALSKLKMFETRISKFEI